MQKKMRLHRPRSLKFRVTILTYQSSLILLVFCSPYIRAKKDSNLLSSWCDSEGIELSNVLPVTYRQSATHIHAVVSPQMIAPSYIVHSICVAQELALTVG